MKYFSKFLKTVVLGAVFLSICLCGFTGLMTKAETTTWDQVTHFSTDANRIPRIVEFNGKLYASLMNDGGNNPEVWVSDGDGLNWSKVQGYSTELATVAEGGLLFFNEMAVFDGYLYVVTSLAGGGGVAVLRTNDGTNWSIKLPAELQTFGAFGGRVTNLRVFGDYLYYFGSDPSDEGGLTVVRSDSDLNYTVVAQPVNFGGASTFSALTSQIYFGKLYIGTSGDILTGAQAWFTEDGTTWIKTTGNLGDNGANILSESSFVLNNNLFIVTYALDESGIAPHVFQTINGADWTDVNQNGLPTAFTGFNAFEYGSQATTTGGKVYLPVSDFTIGAGLYSSSDGITWTLEPTYTPDPDHDFILSECVTLFNNRLYTAIDRSTGVGIGKRGILQTDIAYAADVNLDEGAFILRSAEVTEPTPTPTPTATETPPVTVLPQTGGNQLYLPTPRPSVEQSRRAGQKR